MHPLLIPAFAIVATLAAPELVTDRYYPDSTAISPSGRYRIDAKSPDNAGPNPRPFASNFTYTLTDTTTNKIIWTRQQPMRREKGSTYTHSDEPSPIAVFVADDGVVVVESAFYSLIVLDPSAGGKRGEFNVLRAFPAPEQKDFVHDTTAGPMWSQRSDWFFLDLPAKDKTPAARLFVVRPYWHHRIVIDCASAKPVELGVYHSASDPAELADASPEIKRTLTAIMSEESARALSTLKSRLSKLDKDPDYRAFRAVSAALQTVVFRKLSEAEPDLRALERELIDSRTNRASLLDDVRRSLRAIGKVPSPDQKGYLPQQRVANAPTITESMSMDKIKELLGPPDGSIYENGHGVDFDVDATPPYTLRVINGNDGRISVRTITPLAFLHDPKRMFGY